MRESSCCRIASISFDYRRSNIPFLRRHLKGSAYEVITFATCEEGLMVRRGIRSVRSCLISTSSRCKPPATSGRSQVSPEVVLRSGAGLRNDNRPSCSGRRRLLWKFLFLQSQRHTFDILFSADSERPKLLEEEGSGTTYVAGHLALCSSTSNHINEERTLSSKEFQCRREITPSCALRSSLQEPVQ